MKGYGFTRCICATKAKSAITSYEYLIDEEREKQNVFCTDVGRRKI